MVAEQILKIEPENELRFRGPFTAPSTSLIKLQNPSSKKVCFKIKTTAPKRYCVRPNAGIINSQGYINIAVVFQPCDLEQSASKHKFMVQAIFAPDGEFNQDELWKETPTSSVMETKLRCSFDLPADSGLNSNDITSSSPLTSPPPEEKPVRASRVESENSAIKTPRQSDDHHDGDSRLRQEMAALREENERLKRKLKANSSSSNYKESSEMMNHGSQALAPPSQTMLFIVLGIIVAMASLFIGKFLL